MSKGGITTRQGELMPCPYSDGTCEKYRLQGQRCQECPFRECPAVGLRAPLGKEREWAMEEARRLGLLPEEVFTEAGKNLTQGDNP